MAVFVPFVLLGALVSAQLTPDQQSYAPTFVGCPADLQWIRPANGLNPQEADWVKGRKVVVADALDSYLGQLNLTGFNKQDYICRIKKHNGSNVPTIGFALSGGGWPAAFTGAGALRAMDSRTPGADKEGTGGLLQSLTYLSGLSGGAWAVASLALYDFPTFDELVPLWQPQIARTTATNNTPFAETATTVFGDMAAKLEKGFNISTADYFGRVYAEEFVPGPYHGVNTTWSNVTTLSNYRSHQMPFPILQAMDILPSDPEYFTIQIPQSNSTIYEITPLELGAWDGVKMFTPTKWLGTRLSHGKPLNTSLCVNQFDKASFILGTTAEAFNFWYIENLSNGTLAQFSKRSIAANERLESHLTPRLPTEDESGSSLKKRATPPPLSSLEQLTVGFNSTFGLSLRDISNAIYPNPWNGLPGQSSPYLKLVDGSEGGQTLPFWGQIQPARGLEFIITWDVSLDGAPYNWENGTNLFDTYKAARAAGLPFPIVPDAATFINRNYTRDPVFFGCDASLTTTKSTDSPIVLYLANSAWSAYTNFTFTQAATTFQQMSDIYTNSFNIMTQGNGTFNSGWPECLACAVIDRSLEKVGLNRTAQCSQCFKKYCWDGTTDDRPVGPIDERLRLFPNETFAEWNATHPF